MVTICHLAGPASTTISGDKSLPTTLNWLSRKHACIKPVNISECVINQKCLENIFSTFIFYQMLFIRCVETHFEAIVLYVIQNTSTQNEHHLLSSLDNCWWQVAQECRLEPVLTVVCNVDNTLPVGFSISDIDQSFMDPRLMRQRQCLNLVLQMAPTRIIKSSMSWLRSSRYGVIQLM